MSQDLEIDELTKKIESLERRIRKVPQELTKNKRKEFIGVNVKQRDMFISMDHEKKYREFEQWLLMKTI